MKKMYGHNRKLTDVAPNPKGLVFQLIFCI